MMILLILVGLVVLAIAVAGVAVAIVEETARRDAEKLRRLLDEQQRLGFQERKP